MPKSDTGLPTQLWRRFADQYRRATGLGIIAFQSGGEALPGEDREAGYLCAGLAEGRQKCAAFYRKAVHQVLQSEEPLLFRCPTGLLVFGAPLRLREGEPNGSLALIGGYAFPEEAPAADAASGFAELAGVTRDKAAEIVAATPVMAPRRLLEYASFALFCLKGVVQGHILKDLSTRKQTQVMTLFEVSSDLNRTSSTHEMHALALNTLGVLFDVPSAALMFHDVAAGVFRVQTAMGELEKTLRSWTVPLGAEPLAGLSTPSPRAIRVDDSLILHRLGLPEGAESLAAFGLWGKGGLLGLLVILNGRISTEDEHLIGGFAIQLSLAMENQRLQSEVSERATELRAIHDVSRQFLSCLEPEKLFQTILDEARKATGAQRGSLMLAGEGSRELLIKAVSGLNEKVVQKLRVQPEEGVAGRVFKTGEPILVRNIEQDPRFLRRNRPHYATKSFLCVPIAMDDRVIGVLNLSDKLSGEIFAEEDLRLLQGMTSQVTIAMERSAYYMQTRELRRISITDALTGLLNRRYFQERLAEEVDRTTRHGHSLCLIMIDIDHFKAYNDANGHPAGDRALVMVGRSLRASIRAIDVVSRFGGEEFAVILPETSKHEAREIAERVRKEVETLYFPGEEALPGRRLTISLGVAGFPEDAADLKSLILKADQALYEAKNRGRNRIVVSGVLPSKEPDAAWRKVL